MSKERGMAWCEDPRLTYLNSLGYNIVRLPRTGLLPLEILGREHEKAPEQLGLLPSVWKSAVAVPEVVDEEATLIRGKSTSNIKLEFGLKILEGIISAMGAAIPQLGVAYSRARTVRFEFKDPQIKKIAPLVIGNYLAQGDLNSENPVVRRYMLSEETSAYVVTEVLLSNALRVTALDKGDVGVKLDVPAIKGAVGADVDVSAIGEDESDLVYKGKQLLAFGYKAHEIVYSGDRWDVRRVDPSAENALLKAGEEPAPADAVLFRGAQFLGPAARRS
jgi:hypothetical protein